MYHNKFYFKVEFYDHNLKRVGLKLSSLQFSTQCLNHLKQFYNKGVICLQSE